MMKKIVLLILTVLPFLQAIPANLELPQQHRAIEWQIIQLQEKVESTVENSLNPIVDKTDYVVQVRVEIDESKKLELSPDSLLLRALAHSSNIASLPTKSEKSCPFSCQQIRNEFSECPDPRFLATSTIFPRQTKLWLLIYNLNHTQLCVRKEDGQKAKETSF